MPTALTFQGPGHALPTVTAEVLRPLAPVETQSMPNERETSRDLAGKGTRERTTRVREVRAWQTRPQKARLTSPDHSSVRTQARAVEAESAPAKRTADDAAQRREKEKAAADRPERMPLPGPAEIVGLPTALMRFDGNYDGRLDQSELRHVTIAKDETYSYRGLSRPLARSDDEVVAEPEKMFDEVALAELRPDDAPAPGEPRKLFDDEADDPLLPPLGELEAEETAADYLPEKLYEAAPLPQEHGADNGPYARAASLLRPRDGVDVTA